jgi:hypothetical protein
VADNTTLNTGVGGDVIVTEQPGGAGPKIPVSKIYTGALDVNGGPVTATNPLDVRISDATNTASVKAASTAAAGTDKALVVVVSPNNAVAVTGTFWQATQPVSGTVAVTGTFWQATQPVSGTFWQATQPVSGTVAVTGTFWQATQPVSAASLPLPTGAATLAGQTTLGSQTSKLNDGTNTAAVKAASTAAATTDPALVVTVSPNTPIKTYQNTPTATLTSVAGSATSVTVLASNAARKGAMVVNDSTSIVYIAFSATATSTAFSAKLNASDYYEVPFGYTGIITGIWVTATGSARVTEIT